MIPQSAIENNNKIQELHAKRARVNAEIDAEIQKELNVIDKQYHFDWGRFMQMIVVLLLAFFALWMNKQIFPPNSIFSWEYYLLH